LVLGDIITAINGKNVRNSSDLYRMLDKALVSESRGEAEGTSTWG
jgi:S1-C subfamily serine protease